MRLEDLADIHSAWHAQRIEHNLYRCSVGQEWHVFFRDNAGDHALVSVASGHFVADAQLALACDVNFDLLDDARIDVVSAFDAIHRALAFEFKLGELMFVGSDDLPDFVPDRARVDLDMVVNVGQFAQQRLGDFAIGRNDDLAGHSIDNIKRNFFAEQNVRKRIGQLLGQFFFLPAMIFGDRFELLFCFCRREFLARNFAA